MIEKKCKAGNTLKHFTIWGWVDQGSSKYKWSTQPVASYARPDF